MMTGGKENVILCERGIASANRYTRNTLDCGSIAAFRYQLSGLPIAVDASHGTGIRDLVHPATLAGIMAGASVVLVEAHPNPLIAKSDGFQGLFPEQLRALVRAAREVWRLRRELDRSYLASAAVEKGYLARMEADKARLFRSGHGHNPHKGPSDGVLIRRWCGPWSLPLGRSIAQIASSSHCPTSAVRWKCSDLIRLARMPRFRGQGHRFVSADGPRSRFR